MSAARDRCFDATAQRHAASSARDAVAEAIRVVEEAGPDRGGHLFHRRLPASSVNSRGVFGCVRRNHGALLHHRHGRRQLRLGQSQRLRCGDLDPVALAQSAARKAAASRAPRELPPGRYTVILEPAAVLDLVGQMFADFSATAVRDGRSFLNDRIGKSSSATTSPSTTTRSIRCNRARRSMAKACRAAA